MVTSVNGDALTALTARDRQQTDRTSLSRTTAVSRPAASHDLAAVYDGSDGAPSVSALLAAQDGLNRAAAVSDASIGAGSAIRDLLGLLRDKAAGAQQAATSDEAAALNQDYQQVLQTIDQIAHSASFQGVKLVDGGSSGDLHFKADVRGEASITVTPRDFTTRGPVLGLADTDLLGAQDNLATVLDRIDTARAGISDHLSQLGEQSEQIQTHLAAVGRLQSALTGQSRPGLDADGARLQALQAQQLLTGQAAGVANAAPQTLLALFRT